MKVKLYSLALLIYTILVIVAVYYWTRDYYDKPPITNTVTVNVPVDSSAIISEATEGMVPYEPQNETELAEILGNANAEILRLKALIDSLSTMADSDSSDTGDFELLLPSLEADTTVSWAGLDTLTDTHWTVDVPCSTSVIPLLGEIRQYFSLEMELKFAPAETVVVNNKPLIPWYGWVGVGIVGWELIR